MFLVLGPFQQLWAGNAKEVSDPFGCGTFGKPVEKEFVIFSNHVESIFEYFIKKKCFNKITHILYEKKEGNKEKKKKKTIHCIPSFAQNLLPIHTKKTALAVQ